MIALSQLCEPQKHAKQSNWLSSNNYRGMAGRGQNSQVPRAEHNLVVGLQDDVCAGSG
jgi:hypothetical protein